VVEQRVVQNLANSRLYNLDNSYNASSIWQAFWETAHQFFEAVNAMVKKCDAGLEYSYSRAMRCAVQTLISANLKCDLISY